LISANSYTTVNGDSAQLGRAWVGGCEALGFAYFALVFSRFKLFFGHNFESFEFTIRFSRQVNSCESSLGG